MSKLLVSLGGTCAVTYNIRKFQESKGHSLTRFPFDWAKTSIKQLNSVLEHDFKGYDKLEIKKFSESHPIIDADFSGQSNQRDDSYEVISESTKTQEDTPGSLILINSYKITFAHQIIDKCFVDTFSHFLKEERVKAFQSLSNQNSELVSSRLVFIRFETGKLKNTYLADLNELIQLLSRYSPEKASLRLIVHRDNEELFRNHELVLKSELNNVTFCFNIVYFDSFDEDWRYPKIDWESIFSS